MKIWTNSACLHSYFILWRFHLHLRELHIRIDRVCAYDDCEKFLWEIRLKWEFHCQFQLACCSRSFVSFWWMKNELSALRSSRSTATCHWGNRVWDGRILGIYSRYLWPSPTHPNGSWEQLVNRQASASSIHNSQRKCVIQSATNSLGFSRSTTRKCMIKSH